MTIVETVTGPEIESKVLQAPAAAALHFYQASCPSSWALESRLEHVAGQYAGEISVLLRDLDRDMPVAERFGVMSLPTVLVFHAGKEIPRLDGLITERDLELAFDQAEKAE